MGRLESHGSSLLWQTIMSQTGMSSSPHSACASEDQSSTKSEELSNMRVKFMCSYGGKIIPRPHDGQLRYVGGETRIVAADRNITLPELLQKLRKLAGKPVLLKYQLPAEDLDALISVRSDEDVENMMDEYDKLVQREPSARMRVFLFPEKVHGHNPLVAEEVSKSTEQQFVDALNGVMIPQLPRLLPSRGSPVVPGDSPKLPESLDDGDEDTGIYFDFQLQGRVASPCSPRSMSPHKLPPAQIPVVEAQAAMPLQAPVDSPRVLRQQYFAMQPQPDYHLVHHHHQHQHQQQSRSNSRSPTRNAPLLDVECSRNRAVMSPSRFRDPGGTINTPPEALSQLGHVFYQNRSAGDEVGNGDGSRK